MSNPLVSIGLPVYNGERYLGQALESLISQDYDNFELVISDNASTDSTEMICREFEKRESRVRYIRQDKNIGASGNFDRVLRLANGVYFMWAAHDDLWESTFISKCIEVLQSDLDVVLCHSQGQPIDSRNEFAGLPYVDYSNEEETKRERWRKTHENWHLHAAIYGLMKTEVAKRVRPVQTEPSSDIIFISEISLYGKIAQIPEVLQYKRIADIKSQRYLSAEAMMKYLGADRVNPVRMHRLRVLRNSLGGLKHAEISARERIVLSADLLRIYLRYQIRIDFKEFVKHAMGARKAVE